MTVDEIMEHAMRLNDRLAEEVRKVHRHEYTGDHAANLELIRALEGQVAELLVQCESLRAAQGCTDVAPLPTAREVEELFAAS